jgi:hypothetical protein
MTIDKVNNLTTKIEVMEDTTNKIDKYVSRAWQIAIAIFSVCSFIYLFILCPLNKATSDINEIKDNHLKHIEETISEIRKKQSERDLGDSNRDVKIEKILTILEERNAPRED